MFQRPNNVVRQVEMIKTKLFAMSTIAGGIATLVLLLFVALPASVMAATPSPSPATGADCPGGVTQCTTDATQDCSDADDCNIVTKYVNPFIDFLTVVTGVAVVIGIVSGGIQYSMSAGDPQKAATAKSRIWKAIVALVVYLFLYALLKFLLPKDVLVG